MIFSTVWSKHFPRTQALHDHLTSSWHSQSTTTHKQHSSTTTASRAPPQLSPHFSDHLIADNQRSSMASRTPHSEPFHLRSHVPSTKEPICTSCSGWQHRRKFTKTTTRFSGTARTPPRYHGKRAHSDGTLRAPRHTRRHFVAPPRNHGTESPNFDGNRSRSSHHPRIPGTFKSTTRLSVAPPPRRVYPHALILCGTVTSSTNVPFTVLLKTASQRARRPRLGSIPQFTYDAQIIPCSLHFVRRISATSE